MIESSTQFAFFGHLWWVLLFFAWIIFPLFVGTVLSLAVVVASTVIIIIIVSFWPVFSCFFILCLVFFLLLLLRFTNGVPKFFFFVLFWLRKMLFLEEDFVDIIGFKCLLRKFLVMRNEMLVKLISKILDVLQYDCAGLVIDATQQPLETLTTLQLDVNLVVEKILNWKHAHILIYYGNRQLINQINQHSIPFHEILQFFNL